MNKKLKKLRNRIVETIQGNYTLGNSEQKPKSNPSNTKYRTLITEKIQSRNATKLSGKQKKVYLNASLQPHLSPIISLGKEEIQLSNNSEADRRYITRVKSSNSGNLNNWSLMKDRTLRQGSKASKMMKNLNQIQFESELYWQGSSSYLVAGVKGQYQKMKKNYQDKCLQIEKIKKEYRVDAIKELKVYIEKLERENSKLVEACDKYRCKLRNKQPKAKADLQNLVLQKYQPKDFEEIEYELEARIQKLQIKIQVLGKKNATLSKENKKLSTKVYMQERIIIEKDNNNFRIESKSKRLQAEISQLKQSELKIKEKLKIESQNIEQKLKEAEEALRDQFVSEKKQLLNKVRQRDNKIYKLQKQITHLNSKLQHWKNTGRPHLIENQYQDPDYQNEKYPNQQDNIQVSMLNLQTFVDGMPTDDTKKRKQHSNIKLNFKNSPENNLSIKRDTSLSNLPSQRSIKRGHLKNKMSNSKNTARSNKKINRQRITAKTQKTGSLRCRPVEVNEVQPIVDYLKLKLAYKRINPLEVKRFFQLKKAKSPSIQKNIDQALLRVEQAQTEKKNQISQQNQQQIRWEEQFINLKEVYQVFVQQPFGITQAQAILLSRFIIEDVKQPYIYMNWDSQNSRRMVESIISNLLNYSETDDKTIQKSEQMLRKYEMVLIPALKTVSGRTGKVSRDKFIQILNGLGLERTQSMDDYIVGKMCCFSLSMNELIFSSLYGLKNQE